MKEGDGNAILETMREGKEMLEFGLHKAYAEGQLQPSSQTIKKIQSEAVDNFAEKVKEAMEKHPHGDIWRGEVADIMDEIINDTLKEKGGED